MLLAFWSPKGGCGTSVLAAACALVAGRDRSALLADLAGDQPAILGLATEPEAGLGDWLAAGGEAGPAAIGRLAFEVTPSLSLLPLGKPAPSASEAAGTALAAALGDGADTCVIDLGTATSAAAVALGHAAASGAGGAVVVLRPCYLAFRRAVRHPLLSSSTGAVLFTDAARVLTSRDLRAVLDVRLLAELRPRPAVAAAVDAGLMPVRLPDPIARAARRVLQATGAIDTHP